MPACKETPEYAVAVGEGRHQTRSASVALQTDTVRIVSQSQLMKVHPHNESLTLKRNDEASQSTIQGVQSEEHKILEGSVYIVEEVHAE